MGVFQFLGCWGTSASHLCPNTQETETHPINSSASHAVGFDKQSLPTESPRPDNFAPMPTGLV
jgi:hypothetical protein